MRRASSSAVSNTGLTTADPTPASALALIDSSSWTDNNAPYGVTLAGFSPQDHTQLSVADLANPRNAKYAAYDYLLSNRIDPNAPGRRQRRMHSTARWAPIGQQVIHSSPNGQGMVAGTSNQSATGEFFWGDA